MLVKITEYSFGLIKRVAELELYELFGNEITGGERIELKCIFSPNDCKSTFCYANGGFSRKFLSVVKDFEYCTIEFNDYVFDCAVVEEKDMHSIDERICFFDFRIALSYSMEEDERWWSPDLQGKFMRDLH